MDRVERKGGFFEIVEKIKRRVWTLKKPGLKRDKYTWLTIKEGIWGLVWENRLCQSDDR